MPKCFILQVNSDRDFASTYASTKFVIVQMTGGMLDFEFSMRRKTLRKSRKQAYGEVGTTKRWIKANNLRLWPGQHHWLHLENRETFICILSPSEIVLRSCVVSRINKKRIKSGSKNATLGTGRRPCGFFWCAMEAIQAWVQLPICPWYKTNQPFAVYWTSKGNFGFWPQKVAVGSRFDMESRTLQDLCKKSVLCTWWHGEILFIPLWSNRWELIQRLHSNAWGVNWSFALRSTRRWLYADFKSSWDCVRMGPFDRRASQLLENSWDILQKKTT